MSSSSPTYRQQPTTSSTSRSTEVANLFESVQLGSLVPGKSCLYGAPYAQPRARRRRARRTRGDLLLATLFGGTHRDRGDTNLAHGQRLYQYSRDSFPRTGASVEPNRRSRSQQRRPNRPSAVALWPNLSFILVAEQCATRCSIRNPCQLVRRSLPQVWHRFRSRSR